MISRLDIYIFRQVLLALVVATGGLTVLIWLTQSLRFVDLVVNRGLSFFVFMHLTALLIPSFVAVMLPITTYVVIQFVYQRMATDRELTVMRAAGLSPWALARPALAVALLATLLGYGLSLYAVPASTTNFKTYQWEIRNRLAAFLLQDGVFTPLSDKLTVYVRSRDPDGSLLGILVDDARDPTAHATILAERGRLLDGPGGPRVLLLDGSRQEIDHQTGRLDILTFKQNEIDLADAAKERRHPPDRHVGASARRPAGPASVLRARPCEMAGRGPPAADRTTDDAVLCHGRPVLRARRHFPAPRRHRPPAGHRRCHGRACWPWASASATWPHATAPCCR